MRDMPSCSFASKGVAQTRQRLYTVNLLNDNGSGFGSGLQSGGPNRRGKYSRLHASTGPRSRLTLHPIPR